MTLKVQYPLLGRRTLDFDVRAKWFTAIYDEIRRRIPTEVLRLYYVPVSRATAWTYRIQMLAFESRDAVTHITTQMHAFLLRRRPRAPTVITCYDLVAPWTLTRLRFADRVIVPTAHTRDLLRDAVPLPHEPAVIPLAVPPAYRSGQVVRQQNRILYVGTEQPRKNVEGLFRIVARVVRDAPVVLVKVGAPSPARESLERLAEELGIRDRILWKNVVSEEELLNLYRTSSVTVVPSFVEGFSMPCLEAMACGCPLVASKLSAIPEVVGDGGLLINPRDEAAWAQAILRVLQEDSFSSDLSRRGIERARAFSAVNSAQQTIRVYEETWGDRRGS